MWKPCGPGLNPVISATTRSLFPDSLKTTLPDTVFPLVGLNIVSALPAPEDTKPAAQPATKSVLTTPPTRMNFFIFDVSTCDVARYNE
jgi:hypothetical protein